jgi:hypothetical protein
MPKIKLDSFLYIEKLSCHEQIKNNLLMLIENSLSQQLLSEKSELDISRSDWPISLSEERQWLKYFKEIASSQIIDMYKRCGYNYSEFHNFWFQQYYKDSQHGWHVHTAINFSTVYFLELPEGSSATQIVSPFDQKTIIDVDAKEGDVLIFPGYAIHRGPKNKSDSRKTVIVSDVNIGYPDESYGEGI